MAPFSPTLPLPGPVPLRWAQTATHPDPGQALCTSLGHALCAVPSSPALCPTLGLWELQPVSPQQRPQESLWVPFLSCSLETVLSQCPEAIPRVTSLVSQGRQPFTHQVVEEPFRRDRLGPEGGKQRALCLSHSWEFPVSWE